MKLLQGLKKIIDSILETPAEKIIYMSISDPAGKLNVADATLVRFCNKLGIYGREHIKHAAKSVANKSL